MTSARPEYARARRRCTISLLFSVAVMLTGLVWAYVVGMRAVRVAHPLDHYATTIATLRSEVEQLEARAR